MWDLKALSLWMSSIVSLIVQNLENSKVMRQVVTGLLNKCLIPINVLLIFKSAVTHSHLNELMQQSENCNVNY